MTRRRTAMAMLALILALGFGTAWGTSAAAHAKLKASFPARDAIIGAAPEQVLLTFSEETSPTKSGGSVTDAAGAVVSNAFRVNLARRTQATIDVRSALPPGAYTVRYNTFTEDDSGVEQGAFTFTVREGAPIPTPPSADALAAAAPAAATPATTENGVPLAAWLLLAAVAAGAVAFGVRMFALRGR